MYTMLIEHLPRPGDGGDDLFCSFTSEMIIWADINLIVPYVTLGFENHHVSEI